VGGALARANVAIGARQTIMAGELTRITGTLERAGVAALVYKGPALALQAYDDIHVRAFQDLDLLVRPEDFGRARSALLASGYRPAGGGGTPHPVMFRSECDESLVHMATGVVVELHWAVTPPYFGIRYDIRALFDRSLAINADALAFRAPRLEDTVVLLCINGTKDGWGKLETAIALAEIISRQELDWHLILRIAAEVRARRMLHVALALVEHLLQIPVPPPARASLATDSLARSIACDVRDRIFENPLAALAAKPRLALALRARDSGAERITLLLRRGLTPTSKDVESFPLPSTLWPLYYLLRPMRLLRETITKRFVG
jgi:hypothetical protein